MSRPLPPRAALAAAVATLALGCVAPTSLQTARSAPSGTLRLTAGAAVTVEPSPFEPDRPGDTHAEPSDGSYGFAVPVQLRGALGLPLGLQVHGGLQLWPGAAAGLKWQLVGDATSPFALAVLGEGRLAFGRLDMESITQRQAQADVLTTFALGAGIDLTVAGRAVWSRLDETDAQITPPPVTERMPNPTPPRTGPERTYTGAYRQYGGAVAVSWPGPFGDEPSTHHIELVVMRWLPTDGYRAQSPGWSFTVGYAVSGDVALWGAD